LVVSPTAVFAQELVHRPLVPVDLGQHVLETLVHEAVDFLRIETLRNGSKAGDVCEQHRDLLAFAAEGRAVLEDALGQVRGRVTTRRCESFVGGDHLLPSRMRLRRRPSTAGLRWQSRSAGWRFEPASAGWRLPWRGVGWRL
jgi:hypothetical protein